MREGFTEGKPVAMMTQELRDMFTKYEQYRAPLIARTESVSAASYSDLESVKQTGLSYKKGWINEIDARPTHQQAGEDRRIEVDPEEDLQGDQSLIE